MNNLDTQQDTTDSTARIQLYFTPGGVNEELLKGSRAVVIDVLRAATSIVLALRNDAKYVITAPGVAAASDLASQLPRDDMLLCGERDGKAIDGFDLSNSPSEYTRERVRGRRLIFASTNGAPAVVKASSAKSVFLGGFVNLNAVIDAIMDESDPFPLIIVCSGNNNQFSLEDAVCGGTLIRRIRDRTSKELDLNDGARAAEKLAVEFGENTLRLLNETDNGQYLKTIGFEADLTQCAADSIYSIVPVLVDGRLVRLER